MVANLVFLAFVCSSASSAQGPDLHFEAASVRLSSGRGAEVAFPGGPESPDPTLARYQNVTYKLLLRNAFGVRNYQIFGPSWLDTERYDVNARIAAGSSPREIRVMLQNLLSERLGLAVHQEKRDLPVYELRVSKSGPQLKAWTGPVVDVSKDGGGPHLTFDKDGLPVLPAGRPNIITMAVAGHLHMAARAVPITKFTAMLQNQLRTPVEDLTGLTARYDFTLDFSPSPNGDADGSGVAPDLEAAVREQMGLALILRKSPLDVIVVDHANKAPTAN